jgi:hypothetical protein
MADPSSNEGFVTAPEHGTSRPAGDDIALDAQPGTPEFDRAQKEVMIRGAAEAATETEGQAAVGIGEGESER